MATASRGSTSSRVRTCAINRPRMPAPSFSRSSTSTPSGPPPVSDDVAAVLIDLVGADAADVVRLGLKHGCDGAAVRGGRRPAADQPHAEADEVADADRKGGAGDRGVAVEQADREARTDREQRGLADEFHVQPGGHGDDRDEQGGVGRYRSGGLVGHDVGRVGRHERRRAERLGEHVGCRVDQPERDQRGDDGGDDAGDEDLHRGSQPAAHHEQYDQQRVGGSRRPGWLPTPGSRMSPPGTRLPSSSRSSPSPVSVCSATIASPTIAATPTTVRISRTMSSAGGYAEAAAAPRPGSPGPESALPPRRCPPSTSIVPCRAALSTDHCAAGTRVA